MRVVYLKRATHDLLWWVEYYERVFPEGRDKAKWQFKKTIEMLRGNPLLGRPSAQPGLREFPIPRMPFTLIYRVDRDTLQIARVVDQRSNRPRHKYKTAPDKP